jgi:hypothetical protein
MARSYKKYPIAGIAGKSEKWDKRRWHKKFRSHNKQILKQQLHHDYFVHENLKHVRELSNVWTMNKDGKWHNFIGKKEFNTLSEDKKKAYLKWYWRK